MVLGSPGIDKSASSSTLSSICSRRSDTPCMSGNPVTSNSSNALSTFSKKSLASSKIGTTCPTIVSMVSLMSSTISATKSSTSSTTFPILLVGLMVAGDRVGDGLAGARGAPSVPSMLTVGFAVGLKVGKVRALVGGAVGAATPEGTTVTGGLDTGVIDGADTTGIVGATTGTATGDAVVANVGKGAMVGTFDPAGAWVNSIASLPGVTVGLLASGPSLSLGTPGFSVSPSPCLSSAVTFVEGTVTARTGIFVRMSSVVGAHVGARVEA